MTRFISIILISLSIVNMAEAQLRPSTDNRDLPMNDPFFVYQWALWPKGQIGSMDLDDIHPVQIKTDPKYSMRWQNFDAQMKQDVIVAVVDSGVNRTHPDLQAALLPGVNLTARNPRARNQPLDSVGHGTHMASIIAATGNNRFGMSGISNRIKILPIKVYDKNEGRSAAGPALPTVSERVAEALKIARESKAAVVNLSLGWPRIANTPEVEKAFRDALDAGVVIVAGAGNDHHEAQIYPCAYKRVICVGSINLDGEMSLFSNHGGHVDVLAPGQYILGAWPTTEVSRNFGPKGFELKSGTSQATPFVAAIAAVIKGVYPDASSDEVRARILMTARRWYQTVNFGLLDMTAAVLDPVQYVVAPVFKGLELVHVDPTNLSFELPVHIEGSAQENRSITVRSLSAGVELSQALTPVSSSAARNEKSYVVKGTVRSLSQSNRLKYEVTVNGRSFEHQILLTVDLDRVQHQKVPAPARKISIISDPRGATRLGFWDFEYLSDNRGIRLMTHNWSGRAWASHDVVLSNSNRLYPGFGLIRAAWGLSGQDGYIFAGQTIERVKKANPKFRKPKEDASGEEPEAQPEVIEEEETKEVRLYYLDSNLNVIHDWPVTLEATLAYPNPRDIVLGRAKLKSGESVHVLMFWDDGYIPKPDLNPDRFEFESNLSARRLYYMMPAQVDGATKIETRTLTASALQKFMRRTLNLYDTTDVEVIGTKTQSLEDIQNGVVRLLLFVGQGVQGTVYQLTVRDLSDPFNANELVALNTNGLDIRGGLHEEGLQIGAGVDRLTDIQTLYSFVSGRSLFEDGLSFHPQYLSIPMTGEKIISTIKSFVRDEDRLSLIETSDYLRAQGQWNGRQIDTQIGVYRSSFLPGKMFSQLFVPVLVGQQLSPGVMIDHSQFFSQTMSIYSLDGDGKLVAPLRHSFFIPDNCVVGRSVLRTEMGYSRLMLLCQTAAEKSELRLIDLTER